MIPPTPHTPTAGQGETRMTAEELNELEVWVNDHYRPCTDEWPRITKLIRALRTTMRLPDPDIRPLTLDQFTARRRQREVLERGGHDAAQPTSPTAPLPPAGGEQQGGQAITDAVAVLRRHNAWRRHDGEPCDPPDSGLAIGRAIDTVCNAIETDLAAVRAGYFAISAADSRTMREQCEARVSALRQRDEYKARVAALEAERDRLAAIVDKLPKTADGKPIYPGMMVYGNRGHSYHVASEVTVHSEWSERGMNWLDYGNCYADKAAALASSSPAGEGTREAGQP